MIGYCHIGANGIHREMSNVQCHSNDKTVSVLLFLFSKYIISVNYTMSTAGNPQYLFFCSMWI